MTQLISPPAQRRSRLFGTAESRRAGTGTAHAPENQRCTRPLPRGSAAGQGGPHDRTASDGHRDRVRDLRPRPPQRQRHAHLVPDRQRLRRGDAPGAPRPLGLRGGEPAAGRPRLRPRPRGRRLQPADRRGHRPRQRHPHQRRAALRRPRAPGVLLARGHQPARRRAVGQGRRADHGRGRRRAAELPGAAADPPVQEQHRQQGRLLRHARELPDEAADRRSPTSCAT